MEKDILDEIRDKSNPLITDRQVVEVLEKARNEIIRLRTKRGEPAHQNGGCQIGSGPRIRGIWSVPYIQKLGIQDHCYELLALIDELRVEKVYTKYAKNDKESAKAIQEGLDNETMDLFLILERWAENRQDLRVARVKVFEEKSKADAVTEDR